jgi:hypothetical protein
MQFPYKIYQARNPSVPAYIYLGKAAISNYFFPNQARKDCQDVFIFATLVGGKNIKITAATETDPYIYIDTRWTNFVSSPDTSGSYSFLKNSTVDNNFTLSANFRTINSDGSLLIKSGAKSKFFWNGLEHVEDPDITQDISCQTEGATKEDGQIIIKRYDYTLRDSPITKPFWDKKSVSLIDDKIVNQDKYKVLLQLKSIVGSECIKVENTERNTIKISFNKDNCPCGCFDFNTSESSSSSSFDAIICAGLSSYCLSSSSNSSSSFSSPSSNSSSSFSSSSSSSISSKSSNSSSSKSSKSSNSSSSSSKSSKSSNSSSSSSNSSSSFDNRCEPILLASPSVVGSFFGGSVSVTDGGTLIAVGAPNEKAVYLFSTPITVPTASPGYSQVTKITGIDKDFGWSVKFSANGKWLAIGAPGYNDDQGKVYIYENSSWVTPAASFIGSNTLSKSSTPNAVGHRFGHSVAINAEANTTFSLVVGCPYFTADVNTNGINAGAVFSYKFDGLIYGYEQIITPTDAQQQDLFGWAVSITPSGLKAAISSPHNYINGIRSGCAYLYDCVTWDLINKLIPSDGAQDDLFGSSISIGEYDETAYVAVGAPHHNNDFGAVYVFTQIETDLSQQQLNITNLTSYEGVGFDVSINGCGSILAVSSVPRNYSFNPFSGLTRFFIQTSKLTNTWIDGTQTTPLNRLPDRVFTGLTMNDGFGYRVGISNNGSHFGITAPHYQNEIGFTQLISLESDCFNAVADCNASYDFRSSSSSSKSSVSGSTSSSSSKSSASSNSSSSSLSNSSGSSNSSSSSSKSSLSSNSSGSSNSSSSSSSSSKSSLSSNSSLSSQSAVGGFGILGFGLGGFGV